MQRLETSSPFVLIDDAREDGSAGARLFTRPHGVIRANHYSEIRPALEQARSHVSKDAFLAGFISYEAGLALEARLSHLNSADNHDTRLPDERDSPPLLWMGVFDKNESITSEALAALLPDPAGGWLGPVRPAISPDEYCAMVERVQNYIAAGDVYQINLTFNADLAIDGDPLALYAQLRKASHHRWGAAIFTGEHWVLSASPELFFTSEQGLLTARPMKGTAPRHSDSDDDRAAMAALQNSPKERAENLMIVDLIRNDLARISEPSSVQTTRLFEVESYPTVHQMTSTVTSRLTPRHDIIDVIEALFPCGSVTGAPKIRAMEIISATEKSKRGLYTGSIGWIGPNNNAAFNVAIRTLVIPAHSKTAHLGLGSAIVADSVASSEWQECLAKSAFTHAASLPFDLIETMRFDPMSGIDHLDYHIQRLDLSARHFGFRLNRHEIRNELQAAVFPLTMPSRVRLLVGPSGAIAIETAPLPPLPDQPVDVAIRPLPVSSDDFRLRHKTTSRSFLDDARRASGAFETLFVDQHNQLTEGSFTSLFVERDGKLLTPPAARGLLPGILRRILIEQGRAIEAEIVPDDLCHGFFIGNALRGLIRARLVAAGP